jgi:hypothetical protein
MTRAAVCAVLWAMTLVGLVGCGPSGGYLFELRESRIFHLPPDFRPYRVAATDSGGIAVVSIAPTKALMIHGQQELLVDLGDSTVIAARLDPQDPGRIELMDGTGRISIYRFGVFLSDSAPEHIVRVQPANAVGTASGWFIRPKSDENLTLMWWRGGEITQIYEGTKEDGRGDEPDDYYLTPGSSSVVLSTSRAPFRLLTVDTTGRVGVNAVWSVDKLDRDGAGHWFAYPAVQIERSYVQTVVDLWSDQYWLLLFNEHGEVVRTQKINAPLVIVGSIPVKRELIVLRNYGTPEMAFYSWTGGAHPFSRRS